MATKSANLYARIEPDVKEQAESILSALGIPASNAINMIYKQIILNRGLPFEVKIPTTKPVKLAELTEAELNAELEEGYADMVAGRTKPARQAFADIARESFSNSVNIPPTLYKNQGEIITLIVGQDLDFSKIYKLKMK